LAQAGILWAVEGHIACSDFPGKYSVNPQVGIEAVVFTTDEITDQS